MIEYILNDPDALTAAQASAWTACAARLQTLVPPNRTTQLRGSGWLLSKMPQDAEWILDGFAKLAEATKTPDSPLAAIQHSVEETRALLRTSGIDWSLDSLQALLPQVAAIAGWTPEQLKTVREIGVQPVVVTADNCQTAWMTYVANQAYAVIRQTRIDWDALAAEIRSRIESGQLSREGVVEAVSLAWS